MEDTPFYESMTKEQLYKRWIYFEKSSETHNETAKYYQKELAKSHELLGRVIHQASEIWDKVNLTEYFPTDNLWSKRTVSNPTGKESKCN